MEPIINPWIVYVINMFDNVYLVLLIMIVALAIALIVYMAYFMAVKDDMIEYEDRHKKSQLCSYKFTEEAFNKYLEKYNLKINNCVKIMKKIVVSLAIVIVLLILIPSQETMYTMFTLHYVTEDNIKMVGDSAQDVVDYIFDKIEEITDNNADETSEDVKYSTENK